jgi:hypothetical protein
MCVISARFARRYQCVGHMGVAEVGAQADDVTRHCLGVGGAGLQEARREGMVQVMDPGLAGSGRAAKPNRSGQPQEDSVRRRID